MALKKVSMEHPHFPPEQEFGVYGVGLLTNDGTSVDVDDDDFLAQTGNTLEDALAGDAVISVQGGKKNPPPEEESPSATTESTTESASETAIKASTTTTSSSGGGGS